MSGIGPSFDSLIVRQLLQCIHDQSLVPYRENGGTIGLRSVRLGQNKNIVYLPKRYLPGKKTSYSNSFIDLFFRNYLFLSPDFVCVSAHCIQC